MKLLLYCTKAKPYLNDYRLMENCNQFVVMNKSYNNLNGKIVAECDFEVEEANYRSGEFVCNRYYLEILKKSCLTDKQMYDYLKGEKGYAIHIKNLHIFDEPKELSECHYLTLEKGFLRQIKKAPQNMCYALTTRYDKDILISIRPEWLCKILNGEKTIEVRKKVLKEMLR